MRKKNGELTKKEPKQTYGLAKCSKTRNNASYFIV